MKTLNDDERANQRAALEAFWRRENAEYKARQRRQVLKFVVVAVVVAALSAVALMFGVGR